MEEQDMDDYNIETPSAGPQEPEELSAQEKSELEELNNKYLRLYAEFDNYKRRVNRDKEERAKYGNESLVYEILPIIDSLELALKHSSEETQAGLVQGVEMTLKELQRTLEKFGVSRIEAAGKEFDPSIHHAMAQVERDDLDDKMVAEELRPGYLYHDKVLRPSLVTVSIKPQKSAEQACEDVDEMSEKIKINFEEDK